MNHNEVAKSKIPLMLKELCLPTFGKLWEDCSKQADSQGWGSARFLAVLCEQELNGRDSRRLQRHLNESGLSRGKTLSSFNFGHLSMLNKTQICTIASGDIWIAQGSNVLIFGPSGVGKTHLANAMGVELIQNEHRVLFIRTTELVQKLQLAKQNLTLPSALSKLDKYDCIILDDFGYVQKNQYETSVLFELIADRYERKSMIITCNQPFGEWDNIFQDKTMAVAAIDRLVHHSRIIQINAESYRKADALKKMGEDK
jgi:DNA replication protein DnaC